MPAYNLVVFMNGDSTGIVLGAELEGRGYRVRVAKDRPHTLDLCRKENPDLLFFNATLADSGSYDLLTSLRNQYPLLKSIVITADGTIDNAKKAKIMGADNFIPLPYDFEELLGILKETLELSP